jgi:hypothetical protein
MEGEKGVTRRGIDDESGEEKGKRKVQGEGLERQSEGRCKVVRGGVVSEVLNDRDPTLIGVSSSTEVSKAQQRGTFLRVYPPPPETNKQTDRQTDRNRKKGRQVRSGK